MDKSIKLERVELKDILELQKISRQTFFETFSTQNTEEDIQKYLKESLSLEKITSELNNDGSDFYFALLDKDIIGYLKLNFGDSQTELRDSKALEIERIYVLKEFQGKNIGHLFYEKALEVALRLKVDYIWLGVWEENSIAIHFYKKKGFVEFDKHIFKLGNDEQTDIMMKLKIH